MKLNKIILAVVLGFVLSLPSVFAQSGIFANSWVIFITNLLIVWVILFILASFVPTQDNKVKVVLWIATVVLAFVIVWNWGGRGDVYIWRVDWIANYIGLWFIVNTLILGAVGYFGLGFLEVNPTTKQGQIGMVLVVLLFSGIIANEIGDQFILSTDNAKALQEYLFGKEVNTGRQGIATKVVGGQTIREVVPITKGGIFTYQYPNYRLLIFIVSLILFSWFFTGFLLPQSGKLSYVLAFIIAANLASRGTPMNTMITIGEVFAIIMVQKQITSQGGIFSGFIGWFTTITLVEFIFCAVFGYSAIAIQISETLGKFTIPPINIIGAVSFGGWSPFANLPTACETFAKVIGSPVEVPGVIKPAPSGAAPGAAPSARVPPTGKPPVSDPIWCHWIFKKIGLC
jgi:hypothetical protein